MTEITITTDDYEVTADTPQDAVKAILELECEQARGQSETEDSPTDGWGQHLAGTTLELGDEAKLSVKFTPAERDTDEDEE